MIIGNAGGAILFVVEMKTKQAIALYGAEHNMAFLVSVILALLKRNPVAKS